MEFKHIPVLLEDTIKGLNIKPNGIYVDGTIGGAGHSEKIIEKLSQEGMLIGIDRDEEALNAARIRLSKYNNFSNQIKETTINNIEALRNLNFDFTEELE